MSTALEQATDLLKSLSPDERAALIAAAQGAGETSEVQLSQERLTKALEVLGPKLAKALRAPEPAAHEVDATGFLKGIDDRITGVGEGVTALGEGLKANGELSKALVAELAELRKGYGSVSAELAELRKGMAAPQPGRALTGAQPVKPPEGDTGGGGAGMTRGQLIKSLQDKFTAEQNAGRKHAIGEEIARVNAGCAANVELCKSLGINLGL